MAVSQALSIAIFGGTFDPVHYGHLRAAEEIRVALGMNRFHLLPCGNPPHRAAPRALPSQRVEMLRLAIGEAPGFSLDLREVERPGPSYMVDTLESLRAENPRSALALVIGQDAANSLDRWHRWRDLFDLAHLVIMSRHGDRADYTAKLEKIVSGRKVHNAESLTHKRFGKVLELPIDSLPISASAIRSMIGEGHSPRFLLPHAVLDYILENRLYT